MSIADEAMAKAGAALIDWFLSSQTADPRMKEAIKTLIGMKSMQYSDGELGEMMESYPDHLRAQRVEGIDAKGHKRRIIFI